LIREAPDDKTAAKAAKERLGWAGHWGDGSRWQGTPKGLECQVGDRKGRITYAEIALVARFPQPAPAAEDPVEAANARRKAAWRAYSKASGKPEAEWMPLLRAANAAEDEYIRLVNGRAG
jgi:hypothetical protein